MNPPKVEYLDYIHFLVAAQKTFTCNEASRSHPDRDATRRLHAPATETASNPRNSSGEALWQEAEPVVERGKGLLILDDTTLDKPYANKIEHVTWHWSGKHGKAVKGINLLTLLWRGSAENGTSEDDTSEEEDSGKVSREPHVPCDFRFCEKGGKTKSEHFRDTLDRAAERNFAPEIVLFDSWYSSLDNLKKVRELEWTFLTRLKRNRKVNPDDSFNRRIENVPIPEDGRVVHLKASDS
jgi:hypothetical protein